MLPRCLRCATLGVETLISDSGITRYRIKAPEWLIYENAKEPLLVFPEGLYVEKFDSVFAPEALIQGDTATYFKNKQLWRLDKNVRIENTKQEVFLTSQIFWDPAQTRNLFRLVYPHRNSRRGYRGLWLYLERTDDPLCHTPYQWHIPH